MKPLTIQKTVSFINTNQVHYFCTNAEGVLIHFNDFFINQFNQELAQRFSLSIFNEIGKPILRAKFEVDRINAFFNSSRRKSTNGPCAKEQLFFLAEQSLLSIERIKIKKIQTDVFLKTYFELALFLKKKSTTIVIAFLIRTLYTETYTNTKSLLLSLSIFKRNASANYTKRKNIRSKTQACSKQLYSDYSDLGFDQPTYFHEVFQKQLELPQTISSYHSHLPL
jgi:hypothetical protein